MKILFPDYVYILRGYTDDEDQVHKLDLNYWLMERGIHQSDDILDDTLELIKRLISTMPVAACLPGNILVMSRGPGPLIQAAGLSELASIPNSDALNKKPSRSTLRGDLGISPSNGYEDGKPNINKESVEKFLEQNAVDLLIRGRQLAPESVALQPAGVLTLTAYTNYDDMMGDAGSWITIHGKKIFVHRWYHAELSQESMFACKYPGGRNALGKRLDWQAEKERCLRHKFFQ